MITINEEEFMKFMSCFEKTPLPENKGLVKKILDKRKGDLVIVEDADRGYCLGRLNSTKAKGYSLENNGNLQELPYSSLKALYLPPHNGKGFD